MGSKDTREKKLGKIDAFLKSIYDEFDPAYNMTDILADLRHLCDRDGIDFANQDRIAYQHYIAEVVANTHTKKATKKS